MLSIPLHHLSLIVSLLETERIRNKSDDDIVIINVRKTMDTLFGITNPLFGIITEESDTEFYCIEKNVAQQSNFSTMKKSKQKKSDT